MQYLATTSHALLSIDSTTGAIETVHSGSGLYYGIASDGRNFYVAARRRLVSDARSEERGHILVFDHELKLVDTWDAPFPLRDMHQILWWCDRLWITCSFDNLIAITDGRNWQRWYPLGEPASEPYDRNHFNSLAVHDDNLIVVAHNYGKSELLFFDAASLELQNRIQLGMQAHNVWQQGRGEWVTCSSGKERLVGSRRFKLKTGRFPRGYAATHDEIAIGLSERKERHERDFSCGAINIYDSRWRLRKQLELGRCGLVLDILALVSAPNAGAAEARHRNYQHGLDQDRALHQPEHSLQFALKTFA
jgi:hypothetical protein